MTPELLFDRPALVAHLAPRLTEWANTMIAILEKHRNAMDSCRCVEEIKQASGELGVRMTQMMYSDGNTGNTRTLRPTLSDQERDMLSFDTGGGHHHDNVECMEDILEEISGGEHGASAAVKIAHCMGMEALAERGIVATAFDPVALRVLDMVNDHAVDFVEQFPGNMIHVEAPVEGRGLRTLEKAWFHALFDEKPPTAGNEKHKSAAAAFGHLQFTRRLGVITVKTQRHETGCLRSDTIFIEQDIPEAMKISSAGKLLDEMLDLPLTNGLGLKVVLVEPAGGPTPGIAIRTDSKERLTIVTRKTRTEDKEAT